MNIYVLSIIAVSILFIPVPFADGGTDADVFDLIESLADDIIGKHITAAENIQFVRASDGSSVYLFVQIIHRDSDGNLMGVIQTDRMVFVNADILNYYVDHKGMARTVEGPVPNGSHFEIFGEKYTNIQPIKNITASTYFVVEWETDDNPERIQEIGARFAHEGLLLSPGDIVETVWNFARFLP